MSQQIYLVTSGDLRQSANEICWPAQAKLEQTLTKVFADLGYELKRASPYSETARHGFISSQRMGMEVFMDIPPSGSGHSKPPNCSWNCSDTGIRNSVALDWEEKQERCKEGGLRTDSRL